MNYVQPIRDPEKVNAMINYLKNRKERDYMLFLIGISVGLRISDMLTLQKEDVLYDHMDIVEKKTKKRKRVKILPYIRKEVQTYIKSLHEGEYLFKSRQGDNRPIDRSTAYRILREAAEACGIREIGTHTLRKTFGYHFYLDTKDVVTLQELFNHSSTTLRYIGINQDGLDKAMDKFKPSWLK
ncbi:tyrosine-type recombinase/integrase [Lysinibacillus sp. NPDC056232]|uniref:tyrosine-type recombinase/integrase n=1 Tax=Lysinibacillus sp. NPDC056232 TaxID=3345756 RepID=UPI0035E1FC62